MTFLQLIPDLILPAVIFLYTIIISGVDHAEYTYSMKERNAYSPCDAVLSYRIFKKVYAANPQNWKIKTYKRYDYSGTRRFMYYAWSNPVDHKQYRVFFSSYWGYKAMKIAYRASWLKRRLQKNRQKKIDETETSLAFVETVRTALTKQAEEAAEAYEKCVDEELRKAKQRAARYTNDNEAKKYISVFPGT